MSDSRAFVYDNAPLALQISNQLLCYSRRPDGTSVPTSTPTGGKKRKKPSRTIVPGSLEDAHALCDRCASEPLIIRRVDSRQERDVDTKGLVCLALRFANGLAQRIGVGLGQRREDTYVSVWAP